MADWPILSLTTFLPSIGALLILLVRGEEQAVARNAKAIALATSLLTFIVSLFILVKFDPSSAGFQLVEEHSWIPALGIQYLRGIDGVSVWFVLASTFLTPVCVLASWDSIEKRVKEFMMSLLLLETMLVGMFTALDFILFYIFFEGVLLPMFLMIGVWGGPGRIYAAYKFFIYTFIGSVLMLLAIVAMYLQVGTMDMRVMLDHTFDPSMQKILWLAFFAAFAVKTPMWPFHTWLPFAHVEAPTAGSVMLAGVMLKMGGYGLIRANLQMLPIGSATYTNLVFVMSVVAIIYTSLVALAQTDMKKMIAYSSVAHMGYVSMGIFAANAQGLDGAMFQMLSHTVVSAALFLCIGVVYNRLHTREIARYGGMAHNMPKYAVVFMLFMLASVGLPGTSGFVGEFLSMLGAYEANTWVGLFASTGLVFGAAYMLLLYRKLFYGKLEKPDVIAMPDLNAKEILYFAPLVAIVIMMGVYPKSFSSVYAASLDHILSHHREALAAEGLTPPVANPASAFVPAANAGTLSAHPATSETPGTEPAVEPSTTETPASETPAGAPAQAEPKADANPDAGH
ncbi:NADH-quinone oxidoreductase chain M [Nitrospirillum viridazoti Y2]|uniref:NADH dehydrogenase subunit M n=1 Tax=Nitrospirillum amazonense TaxID=28077 RepID=A0A560IHC3_9PROT|nr:NADH-quinone oxidoreductase subunit M [Nitrospirillum amazonense]EGY01212.1 NADH-quinone oxidoreductase chain M [Nitrospirillum amazonense Y2]TWB56200.1 NADH dehydrogenase subunit M [Nitrospirillum amazonense]